MRGPRVLQAVLSLNPGGTERLLVELAGRLHQAMPMMVCCLDQKGAWAGELEGRGIEVRALDRGAGFQPRLGRALARAARDHRADVLHAHQYSPFVYAALSRMWGPARPLVFTEHGRLSDAPPSARRRAANRVLSRFPERVFAVSEDLKNYITREGFRSQDVAVIYNGIDPGPLPEPEARRAARSRLSVADDVIVVGTIGRLDPVKSFDTAIRAIGVMSKSERVLLMIIGDGPERARLESLVAELRISESVRFLGHRNDAREWLAGCDTYVNSSVSEGVSLTILEAMAAALPIVATAVGGTPEVVTETSGILVPSRDIHRMSEALVRLASDLSLRQRLGAAARQRVDTHFTLTRMIDDYAGVYRTLAEKHEN